MKHILKITLVVFLLNVSIMILQSCEENLLTSNPADLNSVKTTSTSTNFVIDEITNCNMNTKKWLFQNTANAGGRISFVNEPISPFIGNGYVKFECPDKVFLRLSTNQFTGQQLKFISKMSFSTYVENRTLVIDDLYVTIQVDVNGDNKPDFPLVFNPVYQSGKYVNNGWDQGPIIDDTWQTWDMLKGVWWKGPPPPDPDDPQNPAPLFSLEKWIDMYPKATFSVIDQSTQGSIRFTAGSPVFGNDFIGYLDNFKITIKNQTKLFDFEFCQP